jgi:hypothetical protein
MTKSVEKGDSIRVTSRLLQFRLSTLFLAVADVAILTALIKSFGKDGLFFGSIAVPLITGLALIQEPLGGRLSLTVAATLIVHGFTWCVFSPDAYFWRKPHGPGDVLGASLSLGLMAGGLILLALRRRSLAIAWLSTALYFSVLLNVNVIYHDYLLGQLLRDEFGRQAKMTRMSRPSLPGPGNSGAFGRGGFSGLGGGFLLPDATPREGKGVPPDVPADHKGLGDPMFVIEVLGTKIDAARGKH